MKLDTPDPVVKRALLIFRENLARPPTTTEVAKRVGVSRAELARRFHRAFGRAPGGILREMRLVQAASLLAHDEERLTGVAERVGYDSVFAFSRAFRQRFGVPPSDYRRSARTELGRTLCAA